MADFWTLVDWFLFDVGSISCRPLVRFCMVWAVIVQSVVELHIQDKSQKSESALGFLNLWVIVLYFVYGRGEKHLVRDADVGIWQLLYAVS